MRRDAIDVQEDGHFVQRPFRILRFRQAEIHLRRILHGSENLQGQFSRELRGSFNFLGVAINGLFQEAKKDNEKERELEEKNRKAKLAREKAEKEKQEREARKKALIDMNPSETQEGVMDRYNLHVYIGKKLKFMVFFSLLVYWKPCKQEAHSAGNKREKEATDQPGVSI